MNTAQKWFERRYGLLVPSTHIMKADAFVSAGSEAAKPDGCITDALLKRNILSIWMHNDPVYNECFRIGFLKGIG
ncbi:MAG: hypothetical protein A2830_01245 [Candidatus Taylorbacteria bacterium RIFCSPHIGHO2_01_FULL_44_110]|uniref:Uncharacterized protein n=1 Tax=Candidatus Taylorbacteria bacterium RIFCSPHIGHO2_12_FULL_45_16 TaxID=1802315 RepID=A0A1G2N184_9BACT|nr:MAG: hypothetical protein A2830_01245 [Candidatus Taylorbacteria bacterium RIFCSPHIGHO2_01_FULL_44_110]OHA29840.1 MAG: hypothetical protein A3F51_03930 [Candidatus Taylorbacteria bacterium RIFCSPHIGHO2_12_FULL_45_16]OHA39830.1 MAG: hypothetical protein A3I98_03625 [Candidatus Taylorbacteria bacterium RIFCSPLOWO2_02_FULL_45_10b]OHA44585.1 MAG: hypothetical protein A3G04_02080 [Candidatus Taylorbacteria bacterium RIFCSPLOWO2_12_FULL_44_9]